MRRWWLAMVMLGTGCGGGGAMPPEPETEVPTLGSVQVLPSSFSLQVGERAQARVVAQDQAGRLVTDAEISYSIATGSVATVDVQGNVSGVGPGSTELTVTARWRETAKSTAATITVAAGPAAGAGNIVTTPGTSFSPATVTIPAGDSVTWEFSGAIHNVTFTGPAPAGGSIPDQVAGARVTRVFGAAGTYPYDCTRHSGMTGQVVVQGATPAHFTSLTLTPTTPGITVGGTVQLTATALDQNGSAMAGLPSPSFSSNAAAVASVSPAGLVTGIAAGTAEITASLTVAGVTKTAAATVTVTAPSSSGATVTTPSNTFSPASVSIPAGGVVTWQFSGAVHNVTFGTAKPTGGDIPDQNPGNAVSRTFPVPGTYFYDCTRHSGMTGQVVVQGNQPAQFTSLTLTPATPAIAIGGTVQLAATALDQNGSAMTGLPSSTFSSSATAIATVSPTGLVTGAASGTAIITASLTVAGVTKTATATVTVTAPSPSGATVTTPNNTFSPASVSIPAGETVTWQFSGATHNVTFGTAKPTGGDIPDQNPGNAVSRTFPTPGTYPYDCTRHSGMTGQVVVQGSQPTQFTSLTLTPATPGVTVGGTVQLAATPLDQNGSAISGLPAPSFVSSASGVASVSTTGLVTGVTAGTATITASLTAAGTTRTATATVTVTSPSPSSVSVTTPNNSFSPRSVTIPSGGTVTWQFSGGTHNVSFGASKPTGGDIPDQSAGNAVSRTFATPGSYDYQCTRHNGMTGQVIVQSGGGGTGGYASLDLTPASVVLGVGATAQLTAVPRDGAGAPLTGLGSPTFATSASGVATVSSSGVVTALSLGTATITASLTDNGTTHSATTSVTVVGGPLIRIGTPNATFVSDDVDVGVGTTVVWEFSEMTHNVTFKSAAPTGGNIPDTAPGHAVARHFTTSGTFDYECTIHHGMKGRIRVR